MTAALRQPAAYEGAAPSSIEWSEWVHIADASMRLGVAEGHLRRQCKVALGPRAIAIKVTPPAGGKPTWYVHRSHHPSLAAGASGADTACDAAALASYSRRKRDMAMWRRACVMELRHARSTMPGLQRDWLPGLVDRLRRDYAGLKISRGSLLRWDKQLDEPGGLVNLIDSRGGDQKSQGDPAAWKHFRDIYLDQNQPSAKDCWRRTDEWAVDQGVAWCSYPSLVRQLDQRIPSEVQLMHRDPRKWRESMAPYIEQDTERHEAGECWEADHRPLDVLVTDGREIFRPYLTSFTDWRTRKIVGWVLSKNPDSSTILLAIRRAILDESNGGPPVMVRIDNGKDFDAFTFHGQTKQQRRSRVSTTCDQSVHAGLYSLLGIEAKFCQPHAPQSKGRCERFYATVGAQFDKSFPTYTGRCTSDKPEQLAEVIAQARNIPSFEHVESRVGEFIAGYNFRSDHRMDDLVDADGRRLSPGEALAAWRPSVRRLVDPAALELCLQMWHKPVRVGRNGVTIAVKGQRVTFGQFDTSLTRFKGKEVFVSYDPKYLNEVRVWDMEFRIVCVAPINLPGGREADPIQVEHIGELLRRKAAHKRALRVKREHRELEWRSDNEMLARIAGERPAPVVDAPMTIVRTPLDGESKALEAMQTRKLAAGAEGGAAPESARRPITSLAQRDAASSRRITAPLATIGSGAQRPQRSARRPPRTSLSQRKDQP